jgi:hypothetical protein
MSNKEESTKKLATNGYQPQKKDEDKFGYQPTRSQSSSSQGTPPKKP